MPQTRTVPRWVITDFYEDEELDCDATALTAELLSR